VIVTLAKGEITAVTAASVETIGVIEVIAAIGAAEIVMMTGLQVATIVDHVNRGNVANQDHTHRQQKRSDSMWAVGRRVTSLAKSLWAFSQSSAHSAKIRLKE
jgi:hypothetical protein